MSLTPSAAWYNACDRQDAEWRVLVSITDGVTTWKALSGSSTVAAMLFYPSAVLGVSSIAEETDPVTRESEIGELWVEVADAWIRPIVVNNRLIGQKLTATLGVAGLAEADYLALFSGPIEGIEPLDGVRVKLIVGNLLTQLEKTQVSGVWIGKHPYQCLYDGAGGGVLEKAGLSAAEITEATLVPSSYDTSISHFCCCPVGPADGPTIDLPAFGATSALELVNGILQITYSILVNDESGSLKLVRFDDTAASVASLTESDIIEGSFEQDAFDSGIVNQALIRVAQPVFGGLSAAAYKADETASQSDHAYPGLTARVFGREIETNWYSGTFGLLSATITDVALSMNVDFDIHSFCGMRDGYPAAGQDADAKISAARPAYLLLKKWDGSEAEIVKATAATLTDINNWNGIDPSTGSWTTYSYSGKAAYTIVRAQCGTSAVAHTLRDTKVWDITMFVYLAESLFERFAYGVPPVHFDVPLRWAWLQRGDLLTWALDRYLAYGYDGMTAAQKWEITSKEITVLGGEPRIRLGLAWAGVNVPTLEVKAQHWVCPSNDRLSNAESGAVAHGHVMSGLELSATAGLGVSVSSGYAYGGVSGVTGRRASAWAHTCTANKDTYFAADPLSGAIHAYEVATGAAQPTKAGLEVWLGKAVTNGAGVTSVTDLRETKAVTGTKLKEGSGPLTYLSSAGVVNSSSGLASAIVTAPKVADQVIDEQHIYQRRRVVLNPNPNLLRYR